MHPITTAGRKLAMLTLALLVPLASTAHADEPAAVPIHAVLDVDLDAEGRILAIEPSNDVAREIADFLRGEVSGWQFLPATRDGRPVPTRTSVSVLLQATGTRNGETIEVQIVDAGTGPRYAKTKPPRFPQVALDRRETGEVLLRVAFDAAGRVVDVAVEKRAGRPYFDRVAIDAVREWTFHPERAGDAGVAATVFVPIRFCIQGRACKSLPAQPDRPQGDGPRLVGEPAAKILRRGAPG